MEKALADYLQKIGRKGGLARSQKLSPERRRTIARLAALTRWGRTKKKAVA